MFGRALAGGRHYFISVRSMSATFEYQGLNVAQKSQGVVHVELNRPDSRNAFTLQLWEDLYEVFNRLSDYAPCRAIVLSGSGKSFCAGIDVKSAGITGVVEIINREGLDVARKARELRKIIKICQDGFTAVEKCVKPVIVAVHGHCIGAGISLASCCDIRYSTSDAVFSIKVDVGLAADVGILQRIRMITGNDSWARELAFTARNASGSEALSHGLVSRTFDSQQECLAAAFDLAKEIASKSPIAVQGSKVAMNYARNHGVDDSIEWMLTWNCAQLQTEDIVKNVAAMISKESPSFDDA